MEKRLFLAIGLSLIVMWAWSLLMPAPQKITKKTAINTEQFVENKEDIKNSQLPLSSPLSPSETIFQSKDVEKTEILISDKLTVIVSNYGGTIKKVTINEYDESLPIEDIGAIDEYKNSIYEMKKIDDGTIQFTLEDAGQKIVKSYHLIEGDYLIKSSINITNSLEMSKQKRVNIIGYNVKMSNLEKNKEDPSKERDNSLLEYNIYTENEIHRKAKAFKATSKENRDSAEKVYWAGFRDRYFCAIVRPEYENEGYSVYYNDINNELTIKIKAKENVVSAKETVNLNSIIYVGPENAQELKKYQMGFEKIQRYYRLGLFDGVAKIIYSIMNMINKVVPNWGLCIILISCIIYATMYPLTMRSMLSMKKIQTLQPLIANLKEKYKDNPQKLNKEMMELYREKKVNPLGGCLPMLLQMPIFIGLYQVLWRSVVFKGAHFLWIKDLSMPDRLAKLPFDIPFLGNDLNLLPLIMMIVMFIQQKITAKNMVTTDPNQLAQQKMMTTIMPVFLGCIFYKFASGLTLYFTMFYLFSTFSQWKMSKKTVDI